MVLLICGAGKELQKQPLFEYWEVWGMQCAHKGWRMNWKLSRCIIFNTRCSRESVKHPLLECWEVWAKQWAHEGRIWIGILVQCIAFNVWCSERGAKTPFVWILWSVRYAVCILKLESELKVVAMHYFQYVVHRRLCKRPITRILGSMS